MVFFSVGQQSKVVFLYYIKQKKSKLTYDWKSEEVYVR